MKSTVASLISKIKPCDGEAPQGHVEVSGTQMSDLRVKSEIESLTEVVKSLHLVKLFELIWYLSLHSETFASVISFFFFFLDKFSLMSAAAGASCLCVLACWRQKLSSAVTGRRNSQSPGTASSIAQFSRPPQPSSDNLRSVIQ